MSIRERAQVKLEEQTAAAVGVPVLGVASVNRVGTLGQIAANAVMDIGSDLLLGQHVGARGVPGDQIRRESGVPTKLPLAFVLCVSTENVHVFDVRFGPFGRVKLKEELGSFERPGLELGVQEGRVLTAFHMYSPRQGQDMMFEMTGGSSMGGEFARELAALIRIGTPPSWTGGRF